MNISGDVLEISNEEEDNDKGAIFGWLYLAVLLAIFITIALWARGASDDGTATVLLGDPPAATTTVPAALDPAVINVSVDRKVATLTGSVPDEGARSQLIRIAEDRFGNGNVIDELIVDGGADLATGIINISGIADTGDPAPEELQKNAVADLGVSEGAFDIEFVAPQFDPAMIDLAVGEVPVLLTGRVPSESDRDRLLQSAEAVYGEGNVDISGITVEPSDIEGAQFTITGITKPGDTRAGELSAILSADFGSAVVTDGSEIDVSPEALLEFEEALEDALVENPILFDTGTSTISPEGLNNLLVIAEAIEAIPGRGVEIIGHTDDTGGDTVNQLLSENRALAVKEALVELGIEESRLTTTGLGSSDPAVPNSNAANRARNRRIQFVFERS